MTPSATAIDSMRVIVCSLKLRGSLNGEFTGDRLRPL
jgi:hypothetical protein